MTRTLLLSLALAVVLIPRLAAAPQSRQELQMMADQRQLQESVSKLQVRVNQLDDQLKTFGKKLDDLTDTNRTANASSQDMIKTLQNTVATVSVTLNDNTTRMQQLSTEVSGLGKGLGQVTELLNTMVNLLQPSNPTAPATSASVTEPPPALNNLSRSTSASTIFNEARGDYMAGLYDLAIQGFQQYLKDFPSGADAALAQENLGNSYQHLKKYKECQLAFDTFVKNYPNSDHVPDAYLNQGMCYEGLQQWANARRIYELLKVKYPDKAAGISADSRLKVIPAR